MKPQEIKAGSIWKGRGLEIQVLRVGAGVAVVNRRDLPKSLPETFRIHAWGTASFKGMAATRC